MKKTLVYCNVVLRVLGILCCVNGVFASGSDAFQYIVIGLLLCIYAEVGNAQ